MAIQDALPPRTSRTRQQHHCCLWRAAFRYPQNSRSTIVFRRASHHLACTPHTLCSGTPVNRDKRWGAQWLSTCASPNHGIPHPVVAVDQHLWHITTPNTAIYARLQPKETCSSLLRARLLGLKVGYPD